MNKCENDFYITKKKVFIAIRAYFTRVQTQSWYLLKNAFVEGRVY